MTRGAATAIALLGVAATAAAAPTPRQRKQADAAFKKGKRLMSEKHYADACEAFEDSNRLDPEIGAELNLAHCYQEWGKLARALADFKKAEDMAKAANDDRLPKIHEVVEQLDHDVPRLTIKAKLGADTSHAQIELDGVPLGDDQLGQPQLVDPGPHVVEYTGAHGKASKVVPLERGSSSDVVLDLPAAEGPDSHEEHAAPAPQAPEAPAPPGRNQRIAGIVTGGAGIVAMGVASGLALSAKSKYDKALAGDCMGMVNACDPAGLTATHAARHQANVASVVFGAGAAAVAGGVVLYLLAPHEPAEVREHAMYVVPAIGPDGAGIALGGRL